MDAYIEGNWKVSKEELEKVDVVKGMKDMPSHVLLDYMSEFGFKSPADWKNCRALTSK